MRRLKIEHLRGPLAGQFVEPDPGQPRLTVGRYPSAAVQFPADALEVGVEHLELVRDAGRYELRLNTDDPVWVNGSTVTEGYELKEGDEMILGHRRKGPKLRFHYLDDSGLQPSKRRRKQLQNDDAHMRSRSQRQTRKVSFGLTLVAVAAGLAWFMLEERSEQIASSVVQLEDQTRRLSAEAAPRFETLLEERMASVYQVLNRGEKGLSNGGTAWVVADGVLATNAHVAELYHAAREMGNELIVRSPVAPYRDHIVTAVTLHPAYEPFTEFWNRYVPVSRGAAGDLARVEHVPMYDVALMWVSDPEHLAGPLEIAAPEHLQQMKVGEPLAYVGYPTEGLVKSDLSRPTPRLQMGNIVTFESVTRSQDGPEPNKLVVHSLPLTGGSSGSPVFDRHGLVVALANAGNLFKASAGGPRLSNAAQVNFAQRVDFLNPLLYGGDPVNLAVLRDQWKKGLSRYESEIALTRLELAKVRQKWVENHGGGELMVVDAWDREIDREGMEVQGKTIAEWDVGPGKFLISALSLVGRDIDMSLVDPTTGKAVATDVADDYYPVITIDIPSMVQARVTLQDPAMFAGLVKTSPVEFRLYRLASSVADRRPGERTMREFGLAQAAAMVGKVGASAQ